MMKNAGMLVFYVGMQASADIGRVRSIRDAWLDFYSHLSALHWMPSPPTCDPFLLPTL